MYPSTNEPIPELAGQQTTDSPEAQQELLDNVKYQPTEDEIRGAAVELLRFARDDDKFVRDNLVYLWKKLDYYWNNILDIFYDPISRDWQIPDWDNLEDEIPPRLINIFRPHGEAIVAALSVTIPSVNYPPDDADNPDDLEASRAYRNITELLQRHNDGSMLLIRSIVIMFCQGTIFGYNYLHKNPKFGIIKKAKIEPVDVITFNVNCPQCGAPLDAGIVDNTTQGGLGQPEQSIYDCSQCGYQGPAEQQQGIEKLPQIVGFTESPKGMIHQELFSGLQVKVSSFVKKQEECGYLLLEFLQSTAMLRSVFVEKADKIESRQQNYSNESFGKLPARYYGQIPDNACNVSCLWLRPWQFWQLGYGKKDLINYFVSTYPNGVYILFVNDEPMEIYDENIDEHWTISEDPLSGFIYSRPLSENLAVVQDIRANLVEIEIQTAEHGIPETFVDPRVLDFEKYGEGRAKPGMMTKAKPRPGKGLGDAFFTTATATLSQEIDPLRQHIDQDAQFVTGSFPSVYGGPAIGGSKTASEYAQSKSQALQRLGTFWKIICNFWANFQSRSATEYANMLRDLGQDEKFVKKEGNSYVNVWIRNTQLNGKIGKVEPEATEQLPSSWAQKKDAIMALLQYQSPEIMMVLTHPNNAEIMKNAVGLSELYIPGEEDRIRQQKEFMMLKEGIPVNVNPFDKHEIHIEVLESILEGQQGEGIDPQIMQICLMHLQQHMQMMPTPAENTGEQQPDNKEPNNVSSRRQKQE